MNKEQHTKDLSPPSDPEAEVEVKIDTPRRSTRPPPLNPESIVVTEPQSAGAHNSSINSATSTCTSAAGGSGDSQPSNARPGSANPNVKGIIVESQKSRESSPSRTIGSPFHSPGVSPGPFGDRTFALPPARGQSSTTTRPDQPAPAIRPTRLSSSTSDYSVPHGGARPKTTSRQPDSRPKSDLPPADPLDSPGSPRPRTSSDTKFLKNRFNRRKTTSRVDGGNSSPEDVAAQSEDVLKNFMYERYNKDLMSPEGHLEAPQTPSLLENFTPDPQTRTAEIGRKLAFIADEVDTKYDKDFKLMTKMLNLRTNSSALAYHAFCRVCRNLFSDGVITWGRIVALLQFGYHIAMDVLEQSGNFMAQVIKYLLWFITFEKIAKTAISIVEWIANQGGWGAVESFRTTVTERPLVTAAVASIFTIGILATIWYFKPWQR